MPRLITYLFTLLLALPLMAQEKPEAVVKRFLTKVDNNTLVSDFSITVSANATQPYTQNGKIKMRGEKFWVTVFSTEAAYNGKSLYLYQQDVNELTITNPTPEELLEANPVLFVKALMLQATVKFSASAPDGIYSIDFVPDHQSAGVKKFVLRLRKSDLMPVEIRVVETDQTSTLKFKNQKYDSAVPAFTIKKSGAYINDLR